jgi:hypothetical protein
MTGYTIEIVKPVPNTVAGPIHFVIDSVKILLTHMDKNNFSYSIKWTQPYPGWSYDEWSNYVFLENLLVELEEIELEQSDHAQAKSVIAKIKQNIK